MPAGEVRITEDSLLNDDIRVSVNELKLSELLLLLAEELADDRFGGATKANKVMFFAEYANMRLTGRPITGARYQKLKQGPAPRRLLPALPRRAHCHTRRRAGGWWRKATIFRSSPPISHRRRFERVTVCGDAQRRSPRSTRAERFDVARWTVTYRRSAPWSSTACSSVRTEWRWLASTSIPTTGI